MGKIIAIVNQKGGVGKTTTGVNLAAALTALGKKVLLCDFDPQANATSGLGVDKKKIKRTVYHVAIGDCPAQDAVVHTQFADVLPSSADLAGAAAASLFTKIDGADRRTADDFGPCQNRKSHRYTAASAACCAFRL